MPRGSSGRHIAFAMSDASRAVRSVAPAPAGTHPRGRAGGGSQVRPAKWRPNCGNTWRHGHSLGLLWPRLVI